MNQNITRVVVALALLAVLAVTLSALRESNRWRRPDKTARKVVDPYDRLASLLAEGPSVPATSVRDPFRPGNVRVAVGPARPVNVPPPPPKQEIPVVAAIVMDGNEPVALIRYEARNYTVGPGGLFADYSVVSVTADAVVLARAGQQLVLKPPKK